jgi:DHA1 family purine base/nucleoside efflux pump-like MFS transporter
MFVIGTDLFVVSPLLPLIAVDYQISPALAGWRLPRLSPPGPP